MKTEWDYSELAKPYLKRADYAEDVIRNIAGRFPSGMRVKACDVGAGVGHLTIPLAKLGYEVTAVEPNDNMRALGTERLKAFAAVRWFEGTGEHTGQADHVFDLVTFGSSFNVVDRTKALQEVRRILKPHGWFACMWNHRDLDDPLQSAIEKVIRSFAPSYDYGSRREDQTDFLESSEMFIKVEMVEGRLNHTQTLEDCVEAWRSHGTLQRQVGEKFGATVDAIEKLLRAQGKTSIIVPYTTRAWIAQLRS